MVTLPKNNKPDNSRLSDDQQDSDILFFDATKINNMHPFRMLINISRIAKLTGKTVIGHLTGQSFQIKPDASLRDVLTIFQQIAPKMPYNQHSQQQSQNQDDKKIVADLIKNEELDITGFTSIYRYWSEQSPEIIKSFVEPWGKLMQVEMKNNGLTYLTPQLIDKTFKRISTEINLTQDQIDCGIAWMGVTWKFGDQLVKITKNKNYPDLPLIKALTRDSVNDFYDHYVPPKIKSTKDVIENAGYILAHVLQNEHLINRFVKKACEDPKMLDWIPILNVPENKRKNFLEMAANHAKNILHKTASPKNKQRHKGKDQR